MTDRPIDAAETDRYGVGVPIAGRVAVVTGASGGGVGSATAQLLAARGAAVVVNYNQNQAGAQKVVDIIAAAGGLARAIQADVGKREQVEALVAETLQAFGRLDILVSNASAQHFRMAPFADLTWGEFGKGVHGRLQAAFNVAQAALPHMRRQGSGRMVFVSSDHADGPAAPGMIINGTGAAALAIFVRYLACELGPYGITANVVSPGMIDLGERTQRILPQGSKERIADATPLGRVATPGDVARAIAFFVSGDSSFMTGVVSHVNGGFGIARLVPLL